MVELINIGGFHIYLLGVTIAIGILVAYLLSEYEVKRRDLDVRFFETLGVVTIISSLLGARLFYILFFDLQTYLDSPIKIFALRDGGLSVQGGITLGILLTYMYSRYRKANFFEYADAIAPQIALGQFIGRIGCDVFGIPMERVFPWGVKYGNQLVHPVQIYESIANLILFAILWRFKDKTKYKGQLFALYLIGYGTIRFLIEFFRVNPIIVGNITIAHVISLIMIVIGIFIFLLVKKPSNKSILLANEKLNIFYFGTIIFFLGILATTIFYYIRG